MGVFEASGFLRDAAVAAAHELGVFGALGALAAGGGERSAGERSAGELAAALGVPDGHRLRALLDALAALGAIARRGAAFAASGASASPPPRGPAVVPAGWGLLADVIRRDQPLPIEPGGETRYHRHLLEAGAPAAREVAAMLPGGGLIDLGGGAGAYTAAYLEAHAAARATLVDAAAVIPLAADHLARFGERVRLIAGDARDARDAAAGVEVGAGQGGEVALLANVLHLHPPEVCAELCAAAARAVAPGGVVAVVDLRVDEGRGGPIEGLFFALGMAIYTDGGGVYEASRIRGWLEAAGLTGVEVRPLAAAPEAMIVLGRRPAVAGGVEADAATAVAVDAVARELAAALAAAGDDLAFPAPLHAALARAIAHERAEGTPAATERAAALVRHYTELMPRARCELVAGAGEAAAALFHTRLDWARLPRLGGAIDRLYALLAGAGVSALAATGAPSADALRARAPTLAALYARTCYGGMMPLLYGGPADLAYFHARAAEAGLDAHGAIDRYLAAPMVHELCHFGRDREALPLHLDECVAGWLGVHVHPELAYPAPGGDGADAIFAAPWLSQIGQAIARAFGVPAVVQAHAAGAPAALPPAFVRAAARLAWDDWRARRTLHFLSDTLDPDPWVGLALAAGAGRPLDGATLAELARLPPAALAGLPDDPVFDLAIVADGLRAMCLENARTGGSFRTRTALPGDAEGPISIDALAGRIARARRDELLGVLPRYWLPPAVCARIAAAGHAGYELRLGHLTAIPAAAAAICGAPSGPTEADGFSLRPAARPS